MSEQQGSVRPTDGDDIVDRDPVDEKKPEWAPQADREVAEGDAATTDPAESGA